MKRILKISIGIILLREFVKYNLPILLAIFPLFFVEKPRRSPAMPVFFTLTKEKIASQNLGSLFSTNSLSGIIYVGEIVLRYISEDYRNYVKEKIWNRRLKEHVEKSENTIYTTEISNYDN